MIEVRAMKRGKNIGLMNKSVNQRSFVTIVNLELFVSISYIGPMPKTILEREQF